MMWLLLLLFGCALVVRGEPVLHHRDDAEDKTPRNILLMTYSSCTTAEDLTHLALPPVTTMAAMYLPADMESTIKPTSVYTTSSSDHYRSTMSTFPIAVYDPSDLPAIKLAKISAMFQPRTCLRATTSVDYRPACQTGYDFRMEDDRGFSCGKLNPCCYDCAPYNKFCIMNCPRDFFLRCNNGVDYFDGGVTSVDSMYTESFPTMAFSDWSEISTTTSSFSWYFPTPTTDPTASAAGPAADPPATTSTGSAETDGGEKLNGLTAWTASLVAAIAGILAL